MAKTVSDRRVRTDTRAMETAECSDRVTRAMAVERIAVERNGECSVKRCWPRHQDVGLVFLVLSHDSVS